MKLSVPGQTENRKFRPKYIGPYRVSEKLSGVAYRLELPRHLRLHPVFHVDRLRRWKASERIIRPAKTGGKPVNRQGDIFKVEKLLQARTIKRGKRNIQEYLVKWAGYPLEDATWEPDSNLQCDELKRQFRAKDRGKNSVDRKH